MSCHPNSFSKAGESFGAREKTGHTTGIEQVVNLFGICLRALGYVRSFFSLLSTFKALLLTLLIDVLQLQIKKKKKDFGYGGPKSYLFIYLLKVGTDKVINYYPRPSLTPRALLL